MMKLKVIIAVLLCLALIASYSGCVNNPAQFGDQNNNDTPPQLPDEGNNAGNGETSDITSPPALPP